MALVEHDEFSAAESGCRPAAATEQNSVKLSNMQVATCSDEELTVEKNSCNSLSTAFGFPLTTSIYN